jgi:hypothetical protein
MAVYPSRSTKIRTTYNKQQIVGQAKGDSYAKKSTTQVAIYLARVLVLIAAVAVRKAQRKDDNKKYIL